MNERKLRRRIRPGKVAPFLPNLITTAALCSGLLSIGISVQIASLENLEQSAGLVWRGAAFIAVSMVLDMLDGRVARAFGIENRFGVIYDSLSDTVCFGVAPALLVYSCFGGAFENPVLKIGLLIYAVCAALRLARFNIQSMSTERKNFMGLPSPMAAGIVISPILMAGELNIVPPPGSMGIFYSVMAPVAGFFMVSGIKYPKIGLLGSGRFGKGKKFDFLVTSSVVIAVVAIKPGIAVAAVSFAYFASGLLFFLVRFMRPRGASGGEKQNFEFSEKNDGS